MDVAVVDIPEKVFRIGRASDPARFSRISPEDAALKDAGNRFDIPGAGVLYAASSPVACFGETLARFRPTPRMRALLRDEPGFVVCGGVPRDWRTKRVIAEIGTPDQPLPFVDVEDPKTLHCLSRELADEIALLGYSEELDVSDIRNGDRHLSRLVANFAYTAVDEDGDFMFSGLRYVSRLNTDWECWAIFEGTDVQVFSQRSIDLIDADLVEAADLWGLRLF